MKAFLLLALLLTPAHGNAALDLQSGDLVFQTSTSNQAAAIMFATGSAFSHVGIVEVAGNGQKFVIEAVAQVSRTPLATWIRRGKGGRFTAFRYDRISPGQQQALVSAAKAYLGRGYDIYFSSRNNEIYCSELVDLAARRVGLSIGRYQKVRELNVNNAKVRALVQQRWRGHPLCGRARTFDDCWGLILNDELITPASQAADSQLRRLN